MSIVVKNNIHCVCLRDWEVRDFQGTEYKTLRGSSYNSYLIREEKNVLIDTVDHKFSREFVQNLRNEIDLADIDYIVINHAEEDHAGALTELMAQIPDTPIYCTANAIDSINGHHHHPEWNFNVVKTGDTLDIGNGKQLIFVETPMLHWPDSMYTYIPEAKALFTCDSFGCHYADSRVFNDLIEGDFTQAYKYYFDCIIGPFKRPYMVNALEKIKGLDIEFVGNGHRTVLRSDVQKYFGMYAKWCQVPVRETKRIAIAYVSAYGYTRMLAQAIAQGAGAEGCEVQMFDLVTDDKAAAAAAVEDADGFLLGSPTLVGDALPPVYEMLLGLNPIIHKGKFAGAFGSYGWSGEAVPNLVARMQQLKLSLPAEGLRVRFKPAEQDLAAAKEYGAAFARAVKGES